MNTIVAGQADEQGLTARLVEDVSRIASRQPTSRVIQHARNAVLDWIGVTISGAQQPSAQTTHAAMLAEGGNPVANVIGSSHRMNARQAALCGGVASHAQDFDDMGLGIHPSVVIMPGVFALADELGANGASVLDAILQGFETVKIVGAAVGDSSYARGYHCTGSFGAFGAAVAAGKVLGLNPAQMRNALGIAGTQASGLRASFGTMCKHLNAGNAAAVGVLSARLAQGGFTGPEDVLEAPLGFAHTVNNSRDEFDPRNPRAFVEDQLGIEQNVFKLHAACGGTHSAIDGMRAIRAKRPFAIDEVAEVELVVPELLPSICGILEPKTAMEGMFSLHYTVAQALLGRSTGSYDFTDEKMRDAESVAAQKLVKYSVIPGVSAPNLSGMKAPTQVIVKLRNGETLTAAVDVFEPRQDLEPLWADLEAKFHGLVVPVLGESRSRELVGLIARFETLGSIRELTGKTLIQ